MYDNLRVVTDQSLRMDLADDVEQRITQSRQQLYKFNQRFNNITVLSYPHKYSDSINARMPFTCLDFNPRDFESVDDMEAALQDLFGDRLNLDNCRVTRLDICADIMNLPFSEVVSRVYFKRISVDKINLYGTTLYAGGVDLKFRLYDKQREIKYQLKKGNDLRKEEEEIQASGLDCTRIEVLLRPKKCSYYYFKENPESFLSAFDRISFLDIQGIETGLFYYLAPHLKDRYRKSLYSVNHDLIEYVKVSHMAWVENWLVNPLVEAF